VRECLQFPADPNRLSQGEEATICFRSIILVFLAVLVLAILVSTGIKVH
jgi:hypothetical protein